MTTVAEQAPDARSGDLQLAEKAASGDHAAQAAVITRADTALRALAVRLGGADAEDLLQGARAWLLRPEVLRAYQGIGSFDGFLRVVGARTMFAAHRHSEARHWRTHVDLAAERTGTATEDTTSVVDDRLDNPVRHLLARLPRRAQQVVLAVAVLDLSYEETALALDMPADTVGSTYCRALRTFKMASSKIVTWDSWSVEKTVREDFQQ